MNLVTPKPVAKREPTQIYYIVPRLTCVDLYSVTFSYLLALLKNNRPWIIIINLLTSVIYEWD